MWQIIKRPIITEKALKLQAQRQYVFEVDPRSNKIQIKQAIEKLFDVKVEGVRTVRVKGKKRSRFVRGHRIEGRLPLRKKAYVTLKEGYHIDLVEGEAVHTESSS
ncbi:MAG: 50S ribosomal protein L23 [Candidatus Kapabacteria bacterium]|nr:50S ribosomal protein L23 [Candidatus Kapabacteria bacterium]MCS7169471.1 50S ribosomal protein L23 [Candidatus Kapabacteria bacterium]MDW7997228.1 50S ribosomal protein L23 [Bacteroidota bacterium]MDW8224711.1 50S ribosomal protein L23 [Bacteroidota bacterium]